MIDETKTYYAKITVSEDGDWDDIILASAPRASFSFETFYELGSAIKENMPYLIDRKLSVLAKRIWDNRESVGSGASVRRRIEDAK